MPPASWRPRRFSRWRDKPPDLVSNDTLRRTLYWAGLLLIVVALVAALAEFISHVHVAATLLALTILLAYVLAPAVNFFAHPIYLYIPPSYEGKIGIGRFSRPWKISLGEHRRVYRITKRGFPRWLAITIVYILMFLLLLLALGYLIPVLNNQFVSLTSNFPKTLASAELAVNNTIRWIQFNAPPVLQPYVAQLELNAVRMEWVQAQAQAIGPGVMKATTTGVFTGVKTAAGLITTVFLVPVFAFYLLLDADRYHHAIMSFVPPKHKPDVSHLLKDINFVLGRYIRGQIFVCIMIGTSIAVVLSLMGVEYAILIGVFAGVIDFIPYAGVALGMIPAFFISLANHGLFFACMVVFAMWCVHQLEGHVVVPAVLGQSVGLPSLVVIIALLMGAEIAGIMGMFLAIPTVAILRVLGQFYVKKMEEAYAETGETQPSPPVEIVALEEAQSEQVPDRARVDGTSIGGSAGPAAGPVPG